MTVAIVPKQEISMRWPRNNLPIDLDIDGRKHGNEHIFNRLILREIYAQTDGSCFFGLLANVRMKRTNVLNLLKEDVVLPRAEVGESRA